MIKIVTILACLATLPAHAGRIESYMAAKAAANSTTNACAPLDAFFWEVGDATGPQGAGTKGSGYTASTVMPIGSATKMVYAAFVAQLKPLDATDHAYLHHSMGYNSFGPFSCTQAATMSDCAAVGTNGYYTPPDGLFYYGGGNMQQHAIKVMGMGSWTNRALSRRFANVLGVTVNFSEPQAAGGADMSAAAYADMMRKMMVGQLALGRQLGDAAVCTLPGVCPTALYSPTDQAWMYGAGHWVETDGTFSSPGVFGFYPWISGDKTLYGVLARKARPGSAGAESAACGKLIRDAWITGIAR